MAGKVIQAAGGIVVRDGARALIAVVQRSKDDAWVLPRGKLKRDENPAAAARREVIEETGHRVVVKEFLGAMTYRAGGRSKVVQYWRMDAEREPSHDLMADIVAVDWLPLKAAVRRLSYPLEKLFLRHAAARALKKRRAEVKSGKVKPRKPTSAKARPRKARAKSATAKPSKKTRRSKSAAKPPRKLKQQAKTAKARNRAKTTKKDKADRNARKPAKNKGKKAERVSSKTTALVLPAVTSPVAVAQPARPFADSRPAAVKDSVVTTFPGRAGTPDEPGEHRTILQRMLGRIAG